MPNLYWKIYDTATQDTDYWDAVRPLERQATLEQAAANISDSVLEDDGYDDTDANCWVAWGFTPQEWDGSALHAYTNKESVWGAGHVLTATIVEGERPVNMED